MLFQSMEQLNGISIRMTTLETRIVQSLNNATTHEQGEAAIEDHVENEKVAQVQVPNPPPAHELPAVIPQPPMPEWAREVLEREWYETYDTAGDITKKVKMEVQDFEDHIVQNGAYFQPPLHADAPLIGANVKPTDVSTQKSTRPIPKVPSSNAATVMSDTTAPTTPAKAPADASKSFPFQFGSISPGLMNGMQIPARTSSAPPNLDEQKRDQACHDLLRAGLTLPMPSIPVPKQQLPRKDAGTVDQSNTDETYPTPKVKRGVQVSAASHVVETQKPSVHTIPGISMQIPFHQPQVPSQSNTSERDVQVLVASPVVQTQKPSVHPIPGSTRKTVKITHPDTHEELRLDGSSGQRSQDDIDKAAENFVTSTFTVQGAIYTKPSPSALDLSTISLGDKASIVDISLTGNDGIWTKEVDGTTSGMLDQHSARASVPPLSEATLKFEGEGADKISAGLVSLSALGSKDKPLPEPNRGKSNKAKQRRRRKELLQKADAAGTTSDLYMAYRGPEENKETVTSAEIMLSSSSISLKQVYGDSSQEDVVSSQNVDQSKANPDDWKDAADISTPKLETYDEGKHNHGGLQHQGEDEIGVMARKYTRDFLLIFAEQYTDLPDGFDITSDLAGQCIDLPQVPSQSNTGEINPTPKVKNHKKKKKTPKVKRGVQVSVASSVVQTQKPSVHPIPGVSLQIPFHQPHVPIQFGGSSPQIEFQGMTGTSLPMPMPLHFQMGNLPRVQQPVFVPGLQPHRMQTLGIMHQGHGLNFSSPMGPQLPSQLGNLGIGITQQFSQQQAGNFGSTRKTVKITHPDNHEEFRLDG
ncbi:unnamed protein product [Ilex paraguariensis]|uniref:Uncharacterized protein n=1 Tax=Ilex paraguariensis TaxID=185542 RepID=A0ABC8QPS6_9AQUA